MKIVGKLVVFAVVAAVFVVAIVLVGKTSWADGVREKVNKIRAERRAKMEASAPRDADAQGSLPALPEAVEPPDGSAVDAKRADADREPAGRGERAQNRERNRNGERNQNRERGAKTDEKDAPNAAGDPAATNGTPENRRSGDANGTPERQGFGGAGEPGGARRGSGGPGAKPPKLDERAFAEFGGHFALFAGAALLSGVFLALVRKRRAANAA